MGCSFLEIGSMVNKMARALYNLLMELRKKDFG